MCVFETASLLLCCWFFFIVTVAAIVGDYDGSDG